MKKILLTAIALAVCLGIDAAECVRVTPKNGEAVTFMFTEKPEITFSGSKLTVGSLSHPSGIHFEIDDIDAIDFTDGSGIEDLQATGLCVSSDAAGVHFTNVPEGASVNVFSLAGATLCSQSCAGGEFHLLRADYAPGVYIVKINEFSTKIAI